MSDSEELARLHELHQRGALSDDEFARAKARILESVPHPSYAHDAAAAAGAYADAGPDASSWRATSATRPAPALNAINAFRRSRDDRWIGGVCGGIAQLSGLAVWFWRIAFLLMVMCGGAGLLVYVLLWAFVPLED